MLSKIVILRFKIVFFIMYLVTIRKKEVVIKYLLNFDIRVKYYLCKKYLKIWLILQRPTSRSLERINCDKGRTII